VKRELLSAAVVAALCLPVRAEEDVFVSLTRDAARASEMPTNVSVVTAEDIRRSGALTLADALESLPSVDVLETAVPGQYSAVRLRGVPSSNQVQVVVDDQPLGGVFLQDLDIGQIPAEDIERVEIVRGGASALYGANTLGGVVHVITKKAQGDKALTSLGYEARSFDTRVQKGELRLPGRKTDGYAGFARKRTGGFQSNSDGDNLSASGGLGHSFENGARLAVEASRWDAQGGDPQGTPVPLDLWDGRRERAPVNPQARVNQENTLVRVRGRLPVGEATVQTVFYGSNQDYLYDDPFFSSRSETDKNILGNDTRVVLPGRASVGASYERDEYRAKGSAKLHGVNWGLYAQKTFILGDLELLPALRFDQHGNFGNTYNPRMAAVLRLSDGWRVSANAGRSFRSPTLVDLTQSFPETPPFPPFFPGYSEFRANGGLRPETAWSYDAGIEAKTGPEATVSLTAFYTRIRDRIAPTSNAYPVPNSLVNAPRAETSGVEVQAKGRWKSLAHRLSYTYQRAVGNGLASSTYVPLRRTPRHLAAATLTWEAPRGWSLTGGGRYESRQFEQDNEQGLLIPGHTVVDARLAKRILGAELFFAGENLTNRRYADGYGFGVLLPQPGRTFWGGITLRFVD
jgi:outer membrane receptor protein involved in Fe transport